MLKAAVISYDFEAFETPGGMFGPSEKQILIPCMVGFLMVLTRYTLIASSIFKEFAFFLCLETIRFKLYDPHCFVVGAYLSSVNAY